MAPYKLTDLEAARVGAFVTVALQAAAAFGWAGVSDVNAGEATQVLVFTIPLTLAAGEWIRSKVYSRQSMERARYEYDPREVS